MGVKDPRTVQGDTPYLAPEGIGNRPQDKAVNRPKPQEPVAKPEDKNPESPATEAQRNVPASTPFAPDDPSVKSPEYPDTNDRSKEAPPGSTNTPVPQQVPKQQPEPPK